MRSIIAGEEMAREEEGMQSNWREGLMIQAIGIRTRHKELLVKYIETEIIEKLIEEIQDHAEGFGQYCDTGEDMDWRCRSECTEEAVNRLRAKWLNK